MGTVQRYNSASCESRGGDDTTPTVLVRPDPKTKGIPLALLFPVGDDAVNHVHGCEVTASVNAIKL